ncbi:hypothetical protein [Curtobacterium sp. MCSS17_016]|uniref:hypothetical protein n=1 Tax=Curtobacterium sp. MCSS17_016 TaxID=2175644 RepID=UPI000DAA36A6|nr:hypothetical protein [Curtobacterium sp. MCSS17_016]WIE80876.1 hypothetical protein DEJ19_020380 [Curtobacterium sp. MCSS17_016]
MSVRRKDVEGQPDNGGQFAGRTPSDDPAVSLTSGAALAGGRDDRYEWNVVELSDTTPATIDYGSWTQCPCGNSSSGDGFITTDQRGQTHDDQMTCTGLICRNCGNFYPVDGRNEGSHRIRPVARFDVTDQRLKTADDEQWERLYGE